MQEGGPPSDLSRGLRTGYLVAAAVSVCLSSCSAPTNNSGASPAADAGVSSTSGSGSTQATEATAFYQQFQAATDPCDAAGDQAKALLQSHDLVGGYQALTEAQARCKTAFIAVTNMKLPSSAEGDSKAALKAAQDACGIAYWSKRNAYRDVAKVINGDIRPSAQAAAAHSSDQASERLGDCVAGMMKAVHEAGGAVPELDVAKKG
jgi:hypothetical protein